MIIKEFFRTRPDGINLYKKYSDQNVYIKSKDTQKLHTFVITIEFSPTEYEETDIQIKVKSNTLKQED